MMPGHMNLKITFICSEKVTKYSLALCGQKIEYPKKNLPIIEVTTSSIQICDVTRM